MNILVREMTGLDISHDFLESLASLAEVNLSLREAAVIYQRRLRQGIRTFVALHNNEVVGTASLFVEQKFIHKGGKVGHIEDVAVRGDCQRMGIGTQVVALATEEAEKVGCYKVLLNCFEDRVPFYERLGYRKQDEGLRKDVSRAKLRQTHLEGAAIAV